MDNLALNQEFTWLGGTGVVSFEGAVGLGLEYFRHTTGNWVSVLDCDGATPLSFTGSGASLMQMPPGLLRFAGTSVTSLGVVRT